MICFLFALVLGKECAMLIDAGSTGSKFWMYSWPTAEGSWETEIPKGFTGEMLGEVKPEMEKAWGNEIFKEKAMEFMKAKECEPKDNDNVPVWLLATGGLREKTAEERDQIFEEFKDWCASQVPFFLKEAKVLKGEEEAAYAWIAQKWVRQNNQIDENKKNVGVLQMGGESFQVVFEPKNEKVKDPYSVSVKLFGETIELYSKSFDEMGIEPIKKKLKENMNVILRANEKKTFPCLSKDYDLEESTFKWWGWKCKYNKDDCESLLDEFFLYYGDFEDVPEMKDVEFYAISNLQTMVDNLNLFEETKVDTSPKRQELSEQIEKYCAMKLETLKERLEDKWDETRGPWACLYEHIVHHTVIFLQDAFGLEDGNVTYIKDETEMNTWPTGAFIQIMSNEHQPDNSNLLDNSNPDNSKYDL